MKSLKEVLDEIVAKNVKLPAPVFFVYMEGGNTHYGDISSVSSKENKVVLNYVDEEKKCRQKIFLNITQNTFRAELDIEELPAQKKKVEG